MLYYDIQYVEYKSHICMYIVVRAKITNTKYLSVQLRCHKKINMADLTRHIQLKSNYHMEKKNTYIKLKKL